MTCRTSAEVPYYDNDLPEKKKHRKLIHEEVRAEIKAKDKKKPWRIG